MGIFPKIILLKGPIINDPKIKQLLKKRGELSGFYLCEALMVHGVGTDLINKQFIFFGEGDSTQFVMITVENFDHYSAVFITDNDRNYASDITKFLSNSSDNISASANVAPTE